MSQKGKDVHPVRRRAGFLSALAKLYGAVRTLIHSEGTAEEALQIQQKLHERYTAYLESHETALVDIPERKASLNNLILTLRNVTNKPFNCSRRT